MYQQCVGTFIAASFLKCFWYSAQAHTLFSTIPEFLVLSVYPLYKCLSIQTVVWAFLPVCVEFLWKNYCSVFSMATWHGLDNLFIEIIQIAYRKFVFLPFVKGQ